jgi:mono/diheme cytochrome c family protein
MTHGTWMALGLGLTFTSCADPVLSDAVTALGPETSGVDKGAYHRAGQPCGTCHQEGGPASNSVFTVAGTVFAQPLRQVGVEGAEVRMTDADGTTHIAKTNCVGNFMVTPEEWPAKFPILVEIGKGAVRRSMRSAIGRDASCAGCHATGLEVADPLSQLPPIYLFATDEPGSPEGAADCPVDPKRPGTL